MRDVSYFSKIYVFTGFVDFRKQSHGLSVLVKENFDLKVLEPKSLFVFTNRQKRAIKMLSGPDRICFMDKNTGNRSL